MAQIALCARDDRTEALRDDVGRAAGAMDEPRRRIAGMLSGLDIHYDLGEGHPLLGRRMPDLDLGTAAARRGLRAAARRAARAAQPRRAGRADGPYGVLTVDATYDGAWELPVLGEVGAPAAVLVRPDGYVAWVGDGSDDGLADALATWFGPAA